MSDTSKRKRPAETPKQGEAAWRAARDAIARRNEESSKAARARRQEVYERQLAERRAEERRERAELARRRPPNFG